MASLVNVDELQFKPDLSAEQKERLSEFNYDSEHFDYFCPLSKETLIDVIDKLFGLEIHEIEGEPEFCICENELLEIQEEARKILTESGVIGDAINEAIRNIAGIDGANLDKVYTETNLSRWYLSF
jgi:hypothetical protein